MTRVLAGSFSRLLADFADALAADWAWPSPENGFALYAFARHDGEPPFTRSPLSLTEQDEKRMDQAPVVASVGYALSLDELRDDDTRRLWADGLARLSLRNAFPVDRNSFFYRPVELLGVSLGASHNPKVKSEDANWLRGVLADGEQKLAGCEPWAYLLGALAAHLNGLAWRPKPPLQLEEAAAEELALVTWLCVAHPDFAEAVGLGKIEKEAEGELLRRCSVLTLAPHDSARAAVLYVSLRRSVTRLVESSYERYWQVGRDNVDAVELLKVICLRFHLFATRLLSRHGGRQAFEVKDEYDVQDLMHGLLRLHFDDVRPEEWTPSYAGSSSRTDFLLKKEKVVIETKMTRKNLGQREVADELIIDKERYRSHADCKTLVCFVYDPERKCHNPVALEGDLSEEREDLRTVVVVAPKGT
jgi:hypothetical protein